MITQNFIYHDDCYCINCIKLQTVASHDFPLHRIATGYTEILPFDNFKKEQAAFHLPRLMAQKYFTLNSSVSSSGELYFFLFSKTKMKFLSPRHLHLSENQSKLAADMKPCLNTKTQYTLLISLSS